MRNWLTIMMFALGLSALPMATMAQDDPEDETLETVEGDEVSEEGLMLPEEAAEEGHTNSAFGLETANDARERGAEFGRERSEEARDGAAGGDDSPSGPPEL